MADKNVTPAEICLAGGCFWGLEKYISEIHGVIKTEVGYANGKTENPTYEDVCYKNTGHAEVVYVTYDPNVVSLRFLLDLFYDAINPTSKNKQGNDVGTQYRSGIYYIEENDKATITTSIAKLQEKYKEPIAIEVNNLKNYTKAEGYHQKYLDKNPGGYCHIGKEKFNKAKTAIVDPNTYVPLPREQLRDALTPIQYEVTQKNATERPFDNEFWNHYQKGLYVDITSGEPLFLSSDKFESSCGWPSFSRPIDPNTVKQITDTSFGMHRSEVRSRVGDAHLGHIFEDGPKELGGNRYCINSASLKFIPKADMEKKGYGHLVPFVE